MKKHRTLYSELSVISIINPIFLLVLRQRQKVEPKNQSLDFCQTATMATLLEMRSFQPPLSTHSWTKNNKTKADSEAGGRISLFHWLRNTASELKEHTLLPASNHSFIVWDPKIRRHLMPLIKNKHFNEAFYCGQTELHWCWFLIPF